MKIDNQKVYIHSSGDLKKMFNLKYTFSRNHDCDNNQISYNLFASLRRTFRYTCGADSRWHGPECVPIICPAPSSIFIGLYNCTNSYYYNSVCSLHCPTEQRNDQVSTREFSDVFCLKHLFFIIHSPSPLIK